MGMDVVGRAPDCQIGACFQANNAWWHPLATYVTTIAPQITCACKFWYSNDGDGLGEAAARQLAIVLRQKLANGDVSTWKHMREAELAQLPLPTCKACNGTGILTSSLRIRDRTRNRLIPLDDIPELSGQFPRLKKWCNECYGRGNQPRGEDDQVLAFDEEIVERFVEFLEHCGGFQIW